MDDKPQGIVRYSIHSAAGEDYSVDTAIEKAQKAAVDVLEKEIQDGYAFADMKVQTFVGDRGKYVHVLTFVHVKQELVAAGGAPEGTQDDG